MYAEIWSLPNLITIVRIAFTPVFLIALATQNYFMAFIIFVAGSLTDAADGFAARLGHQKTQLGAFLDPLADKLLIIPTYLILALQGLLPAWLIILLACRDAVMLGGWFLYFVKDKKFKARPRWSGKFTIAGQMILYALVISAKAFPNSLIGLEYVLWRDAACLIVAVTAFISFLDYTIFGGHHFVSAAEPAHKIEKAKI